jgi:restriction system protein
LASEAKRAHAQALRDQKAAEKEAKAQYLADRMAEAEEQNAEVHDRLAELQGLLAHTLSVDDVVDFSSLRVVPSIPQFQVPLELQPSSPPQQRVVPPVSWLGRLIPGSASRHAAALELARTTQAAALLRHEAEEARKKAKLGDLRKEHEEQVTRMKADADAQNAEVDELEAQYRAGDEEGVVAYNEMVLERSEYPDADFPQLFRVAYVSASRELVVEYDLPEPSIIPEETEFKYVRTRDVIENKARKPAEIKAIYQHLIASITLRTLHELFEADQANVLSSITFTGIRDTEDLATGHPVRVPVISVRATKEDFMTIRLDRVDSALCLKNLGAHVSPRPDELVPVRPIVEFNMVDKRFIEQGDALSAIESRPNLMDLTPTEFETLVSNLFTKMGLETKLTRSSRDGGVDAVAYDARPILGGKVVIQAKRYKDTVGVSAVRDLYGTMQHEGANKGILVTTSGYGPDAHQFSKDKPIELITGSGLLHLLQEYAGVRARIVPH